MKRSIYIVAGDDEHRIGTVEELLCAAQSATEHERTGDAETDGKAIMHEACIVLAGIVEEMIFSDDEYESCDATGIIIELREDR